MLDPNSSLTRKAEGCETQRPSREGKGRGLPLPKKIYEALNAKFMLEKKETEITALVTAAAALLALGAGLLSLLWFPRF